MVECWKSDQTSGILKFHQSHQKVIHTRVICKVPQRARQSILCSKQISESWVKLLGPPLSMQKTFREP